MSSSRASPRNGAGKTPKRALPSWMSARDNGNGNEDANDNKDDDCQVDGTQKKARGQGKTVKDIGEESGSGKETSSAGPSASAFSKLLDGVVIVLSGFVNPERGILRSHALEMGAEYQQDWNSNSTLLVCAFPNTPKFRQVEGDCGTIVSKLMLLVLLIELHLLLPLDWITECYTQKKLVDIETYLLHVGKPWRKSNTSHSANQVHETSPPSKSCEQEVKRPQVGTSSISSKGLIGVSSKFLKEKFNPLKVKKWAVDDLNKTLTWLESQEEKPEPGEIRNVAAEGILTCLQDAIDLLDKDQDLKQLTEQWNTVPRVVEELIKFQGIKNSSPSVSEEDLRKLALTCKKIYAGELNGKSNISSKKNEQPKSDNRSKVKLGHGTTQEITGNSTEYDSDETIEMTEEEIDNTYNNIVSKMSKS